MQKDYDILLTEFLVQNPQYILINSDPIDDHVGLYIWNLVTDGKGLNKYLFGVGSLVENYTPGNKTLFERVADEE